MSPHDLEERSGEDLPVTNTTTRRTFIKRTIGVCVTLTVLDLINAPSSYGLNDPYSPPGTMYDEMCTGSPAGATSITHDEACTNLASAHARDQHCGGSGGKAGGNTTYDPDAGCLGGIDADNGCGSAVPGTGYFDQDESCSPSPGSEFPDRDKDCTCSATGSADGVHGNPPKPDHPTPPPRLG